MGRGGGQRWEKRGEREDMKRELGSGVRTHKRKTKSRNKKRGPRRGKKCALLAWLPPWPPRRGRGEGRTDWSRSGLSGQFLLGFVGSFSETEAPGKWGRHLTDGSSPPIAPTFHVIRSLQCHSGSSWHTSLVMTFSHFLALPLLALPTPPFQSPGPGIFLPPSHNPARTVLPKEKQSRGALRSVRWPRRHTREDKRGGSHPFHPPPNNARAADC